MSGPETRPGVDGAATDAADAAEAPVDGTPDGEPEGSPDGAPDSAPDSAPDGTVAAQRRLALNEDWLATIVGLVLLALVLLGALPGWVVP